MPRLDENNYRQAVDMLRAGAFKRDWYRGPPIMVRKAITTNFQSPLVIINGNLNAQSYVNDIMQPYLLLLLEQHGQDKTGFVFQQDNTRPHCISNTAVSSAEWGQCCGQPCYQT